MEILIGLAILLALILVAARFASPRDDSTFDAPVTSPRPRKPIKPSKPFDSASATPIAQERTIYGRAYVIDGDSLVINKTQIRLFGVDAPEMNHPFGQKAKWAMVGLCKGNDIRAKIKETDAHGRTVAQCFLADGRDLSEELVKLGLALDWPKYSKGIYRKHETADARRKLRLAAARQKGHMHVWEKFDAQQKTRGSAD